MQRPAQAHSGLAPMGEGCGEMGGSEKDRDVEGGCKTGQGTGGGCGRGGCSNEWAHWILSHIFQVPLPLGLAPAIFLAQIQEDTL